MFHTFVAFRPLSPWAMFFGECFTLSLGHPLKPMNVLHFLAAGIKKGGMFHTLVALELSSQGYVFSKCCAPSLSHPSNSTNVTLSHGQYQDATNVSRFRRFQAFVPRATFFRDHPLNSTNVSYFRVVDTRQ